MLGPGHAGKTDSGGGSRRICGQKEEMGRIEKSLLGRIPGQREGAGNGDVKFGIDIHAALGSAIYTLQRVLQNPLVKIHEIPTQDDRIINNASIRETQ